jgi:hypothetical protein
MSLLEMAYNQTRFEGNTMRMAKLQGEVTKDIIGL